MVSQTGIYALQAVLLLARSDDDAPVSAGTIAETLGIPSGYLAKTLRRLTREGVLRSARGAHGGYRLEAPADALPLARVLEPFQELRTGATCLMGGRCDPAHPCTAHARWSSVTAAAREILEATTVADLLQDDSPTLRLWTGTDA